MRARIEIALVFLFALSICGIEFIIFLSELSFGMKLLVHLVIVNTCIAMTLLYSYLQCDLRFPIYLTILVAALGPFGPVVCLFTLILYSFLSRTSESIKDFFASLFPETHSDASLELYERIMHGLDKYDADYNPLPFMDVIEFGTEKQKRLAIEKILRFFRPEFAPSLLKALDDPSNGIRVLAATAVNTLDRHFFERYLELLKQVKQKPDNFKLTLQFAVHCDQYAQSQILDEGRLDKMVHHAVRGYQKIVAADPKNIYVSGNLARLYVKFAEPSLACELLESQLLLLDEIPSELCKWYMAALYEMEEFEKLRAFSVKHFNLAEEATTAHDVKELILAWGGHSQ